MHFVRKYTRKDEGNLDFQPCRLSLIYRAREYINQETQAPLRKKFERRKDCMMSIWSIRSNLYL
ncbi:unnamed protein product [Malus baccata var. baccata]